MAEPRRQLRDPVKVLAEILAELDQWRREAKDSADTAKKLSDRAIPMMKEQGLKSLRFETPTGTKRTGTLVEPEVTDMDEDGLLADLTAAQRKLIVRPMIDKKALSDAIDTGKIKATVVAKHVTSHEGTPSIRITGR